MKQTVTDFIGNRLQWAWSGGDATSLAELGDPSGTTRYDLCVWDGRAGVSTLVADLAVPDGGGWKIEPNGMKYGSAVSSSRRPAAYTPR